MISGTLTFSAGETEKKIFVQVIGDKIAEGTEDLTVNLTNPKNGSLGDDVSVGTIVDNDVPGSPSAATISAVTTTARDRILAQWTGIGTDGSSAAFSLLPKKRTSKSLQQAADVALTLLQYGPSP